MGERGVNKGETKKEEGWTGGGRGGGWQGGESREERRPCLLSPPFFPAPLCRRAGILTCVDWAALVEGIMRVCVCLISARGGCSVRQRGGVVKKTHGVGFGPRALAKGPPRAERAQKKQGCAAGKGGGARSPPLPRTTTASWRHGARPVRAGEACARGRAWGEGRRRTKKGAGDERRGGGGRKPGERGQAACRSGAGRAPGARPGDPGPPLTAAGAPCPAPPGGRVPWRARAGHGGRWWEAEGQRTARHGKKKKRRPIFCAPAAPCLPPPQARPKTHPQGGYGTRARTSRPARRGG